MNKATLSIQKQSDIKGNKSILLKSDKKLHRIEIDKISHLEAVGDYVKIYLNDKSLLVHGTLQNFIALINDPNIVRVHKSYAVAINKFDHIEGNSINIKDKLIPIGQTFKNEFLERL